VSRKHRVGLTLNGGTQVAFGSLRVDDLTVKIFANVFEFSLTADLAIGKYVLYNSTIGADQTSFVKSTLDLW